MDKLEVKDLLGLAEPATKLVEIVSGAIGTLYEPRKVRKLANAEAYRIKKITDTAKDTNFNGEIEFLDGKITINSKTINNTEIKSLVVNEVKRLFNENENIKKIADFAYNELENEKEKNEILAAFVQTKDTYMLEAWVPVKDTDKVEQLVEKSSDGHCTFELIDVEGTDDEDVPILQTNKGYVKPYEVLVDMYSPVRYNAIDPTFFVAVVFPFLFGYCLTDAFYGAIVAIIGVVLVRGMGKLNDTMKSFGYILTACGIWAIILGLLTNGLLGDFTERMLNYKLPTVVPAVEAFVHPDTILIIAIAIGIIYTNIGFIIGAINNFRYGEIKEAIGSQLCWFVLEAGIIFLVLGFMMPAIGMIGYGIGAVLIIACLAMVIYANGAYGVMDVFGFMGDVLSYARLLALCLATGGIAMTVNILTNLCNDMIPVIGIVLAIFIFIFGHIANFLFQILGAFINSLRLHYVEFFSQFYMEGKNKFQAFKANRTFTKLKN